MINSDCNNRVSKRVSNRVSNRVPKRVFNRVPKRVFNRDSHEIQAKFPTEIPTKLLSESQIEPQIELQSQSPQLILSLHDDLLAIILSFAKNITLCCLTYTSKSIKKRITKLLCEHKINAPNVHKICFDSATLGYFNIFKRAHKNKFPLGDDICGNIAKIIILNF